MSDDNRCPDELAAGRSEWFRLCAAVAAEDNDAIAQVLAGLSCLHPSAWQSTLGVGAGEYVALLEQAVFGGDRARLLEHLGETGMAAVDHAEDAADRHETDDRGDDGPR